MDRTTYQDPAVVALVHERFVPVRVDADRRPDLSERYNLGGWPTTAVLTPNGYVLSGATYLDRDPLIDLLTHAADAWRDRRDQISARIAREEQSALTARIGAAQALDEGGYDEVVQWFRSVLVAEFDATHAGFGDGVKSPHPTALQFAIAVAGDVEGDPLRQIAIETLEAVDALWDPAAGGFFRYAGSRDWTHPSAEKTLDDNTALLHVFLDAAIRWDWAPSRERAAALVRWLKDTLSDSSGGFFNSQSAASERIDRAMYVDRNAGAVAAMLRASALFDDPWLRDFALQTIEAVIAPAYLPGGGVAHAMSGSPIRNLLADQVRATAALLWAHDMTGRLPYSMLAAELLHFAIRTMWDDAAGLFRDRVDPEMPLRPFALNCDAACVLDRLSAITGDRQYRDRALRILSSLAPEYREHGLFAAPYALAVREVAGLHPPVGMNVSPVDWHLDKD